MLDMRSKDSGLGAGVQALPPATPLRGIVIALGQAAIEALRSTQDGLSQNLSARASTQESFDEALRQWGSIATRYTQESVQALVLIA